MDISDLVGLIARANKAYFGRATCIERANFRPFFNRTQVEHHGGRIYVVLRRQREVLAVYRVLNGGRLKRLIRWPVTLI
jgi:hypothetical protein